MLIQVLISEMPKRHQNWIAIQSPNETKKGISHRPNIIGDSHNL